MLVGVLSQERLIKFKIFGNIYDEDIRFNIRLDVMYLVYVNGCNIQR